MPEGVGGRGENQAILTAQFYTAVDFGEEP